MWFTVRCERLRACRLVLEAPKGDEASWIGLHCMGCVPTKLFCSQCCPTDLFGRRFSVRYLTLQSFDNSAQLTTTIDTPVWQNGCAHQSEMMLPQAHRVRQADTLLRVRLSHA